MTDSSTHDFQSDLNVKKRWLCIAYAFAPMQRSGTHRTLAFVRHLSKLGWDATVLTVKTDDEPTDDLLLQNVPPSTRIERTRWLHPIETLKSIYRIPLGFIAKFIPALTIKDTKKSKSAENNITKSSVSGRHHYLAQVKEWITRFFMIPDSRIGWIPFAVMRGFKIIRNEKPEVIYSTSPYMSAHLIAMILSCVMRTEWVADFRDPWCSNPYRDLRFRSLIWWDSLLEWLVLRCASHVVCNTPTMTELLYRRRPFVKNKCSTILNGIDPEKLNGITPVRIAPKEDFILTHCGQFYGPRSPKVWFDALALAIERNSDSHRKIHLLLIGSDQYEGQSLHKMAAVAGVANHVHLMGTKSHAETLSLMAGSDALILAGYDGIGGDLQIPNKLFEYLAVGKPIIAGISSTNPSVNILQGANAPAFICDPNNENAIANAINMIQVGQLDGIKNAWSGVEQFQRKHRASELVQLFQQLGEQDALRKEKGITSTLKSFVERFRKSSTGPSSKGVVSTGVAS